MFCLITSYSPDFLLQFCHNQRKDSLIAGASYCFLRRGGIRELYANARRFEYLCRSFMEENITLMSGAVSALALCLAVCVPVRLYLFGGVATLAIKHHIASRFFKRCCTSAGLFAFMLLPQSAD